MKQSDRINVKCMLVLNYTEHSKDRCTSFDVAFLTEDRKYVEYQLVTRGQKVTPDVQSQYMSLMTEYQLTARSRIYFCGIGEKEPARLILRAMAQPFGIKIYNIDADMIVKRICHIHPNLLNRFDKKLGRYRRDKEPKKYFLQQIWRKIVKLELCPWITAAYDQHIRKRGYREYKYRKQLLRLGMYYMFKVSRKKDYDMIARARRNARLFGKPDYTAEAGLRQPESVKPDLALETEIEPQFRSGLFS